MPFNKRTSNQDQLMSEIMTPDDLDSGLVKPEDYIIEGEDPARLRRILKFTDDAGKSPSGQPTPDRNRAGGKSKS